MYVTPYGGIGDRVVFLALAGLLVSGARSGGCRGSSAAAGGFENSLGLGDSLGDSHGESLRDDPLESLHDGLGDNAQDDFQDSARDVPEARLGLGAPVPGVVQAAAPDGGLHTAAAQAAVRWCARAALRTACTACSAAGHEDAVQDLALSLTACTLRGSRAR
ncbi:Voltage-dependent calcium channel type D subunit alpha-1, partial [Frankliniella fusca]